MTSIPNPWVHLPATPDFVLPEDAPQVYEHNARRGEDYQLQLHVLPESFLGPVDAPVVLLSLNPGYVASDVDDYAPEKRAEMIRGSLTHQLGRDEAFYFLTDKFAGTGGHYWWNKKLAPLIRQVGIENVRRRVQVLEYSSYKSHRYWDLPDALPSQRYTFQLARDALARGALIVVMRSYERWHGAVPELDNGNVHRLKNRQNVTIGPGNCPTGFDGIIQRLA
ncbi:MAG TPA: hypothetical protein ENH00_13530 [Actinobacteria bacterium]|nr:hypothetical protein BMS3Bbin01_02576 [bacterium BMS3Bbin01]HDH27192.1 hypothetical protein [Actinomycetota bacterium]